MLFGVYAGIIFCVGMTFGLCICIFMCCNIYCHFCFYFWVTRSLLFGLPAARANISPYLQEQEWLLGLLDEGSEKMLFFEILHQIIFRYM